MKYQWKKGMSLSFFQNEKRESIGADPEILREVGEHGFDCVELSFSHDEYFYKYRFTEEGNAEKLASYCKESGLKSGASIFRSQTNGICPMMMRKKHWLMTPEADRSCRKSRNPRSSDPSEL